MGEVDVLTDQWRASNGQDKPRGMGRWCFAIDGCEVIIGGTYKEAVRAAKRAAAGAGVRVIELLS